MRKLRQKGAEVQELLDSVQNRTIYGDATQESSGLMSSDDKMKLDQVGERAEANVQADWSQSDSSADDFIKNKPTIDGSPAKNAKHLISSRGVFESLGNVYVDISKSGSKFNILRYVNCDLTLFKNKSVPQVRFNNEVYNLNSFSTNASIYTMVADDCVKEFKFNWITGTMQISQSSVKFVEHYSVEIDTDNNTWNVIGNYSIDNALFLSHQREIEGKDLSIEDYYFKDELQSSHDVSNYQVVWSCIKDGKRYSLIYRPYGNETHVYKVNSVEPKVVKTTPKRLQVVHHMPPLNMQEGYVYVATRRKDRYIKVNIEKETDVTRLFPTINDFKSMIDYTYIRYWERDGHVWVNSDTGRLPLKDIGDVTYIDGKGIVYVSEHAGGVIYEDKIYSTPLNKIGDDLMCLISYGNYAVLANGERGTAVLSRDYFYPKSRFLEIQVLKQENVHEGDTKIKVKRWVSGKHDLNYFRSRDHRVIKDIGYYTVSPFSYKSKGGRSTRKHTINWSRRYYVYIRARWNKGRVKSDWVYYKMYRGGGIKKWNFRNKHR